MAYNTQNLSLMNESPIARGTNQPQIWIYSSADAKATVAAAGYISDPISKGMQVGDVVMVQDTATPMVSLHRVTVAATDAAGATLSAGLNIT